MPKHSKNSSDPLTGFQEATLQLSSVTEFVSCSLITEIMMAVLKYSSYIETFQFSTGQRTVRGSVMSS